jgi:RimJ/RimL family protein N-acetyltransferase
VEPTQHSLADGTRVVLRPIEPADKPRLSRALGRLSQETIRRRFLAAKPRLTSSELRYLTEVDGRNHVAIVAVLADEPDEIAGVARCVRLPDRPDTAEFAIVVGDTRQGRGLGTLLARTLADEARAVGLTRFAASMLEDNLPVRRLMRTITVSLESERVAAGVREVVGSIAA